MLTLHNINHKMIGRQPQLPFERAITSTEIKKRNVLKNILIKTNFKFQKTVTLTVS